MEADSTTFDYCSDNEGRTSLSDVPRFPFTVLPGNLKFYVDNIYKHHKMWKSQLVMWLQKYGLIPQIQPCPTGLPECHMTCKPARVVDSVQWVCDTCGHRLPVRTGTFFMKIPCSLLQVLQLVLAWCEDADYDNPSQYFGVKPRVVRMIFEKLDDIAIAEVTKDKLGDEDSVVLSEMYPNCLNRLSPDTTDQPHKHQILMLADTKHVPTRYRLHVITSDSVGTNTQMENDEAVRAETAAALMNAVSPDAWLLRGGEVARAGWRGDGAALAALATHLDPHMGRFLSDYVWRQAVILCSASRDLCSDGACIGRSKVACAGAVQRYLHVSLYRLRHGDGFYAAMLTTIAHHATCSV